LSRGLRRSTQNEKIYLRKSARSAGVFLPADYADGRRMKRFICEICPTYTCIPQ
jgi:hypothetical protein